MRVCPSGRSGRYAVIYFGSKGDALKACEETHRPGSRLALGLASSGGALEATVLLLEDDIVDDSK